MTKIIVFHLILVSFTCAMNIKMEHQQATLFQGAVTLKADNGLYLSRCHNCGESDYGGPDSASVDQKHLANIMITFTIQYFGDKVALKGDNGKYLAVCRWCWQEAIHQDAAFVNGVTANGVALWIPERQPNGKWAFKGIKDKYLARCENCSPDNTAKNLAFVHITTPTSPLAQWTVEYRFPTGRISLQADTSAYLTRCQGCGPARFPDSASLHEIGFSNIQVFWTVEYVGNQIALLGNNGKYLNLCNNCWNNAVHADAAFVNGDLPTETSLWDVKRLENGKWAFRGSNCKYLARCRSCVTGGKNPDSVFVKDYSPNTPQAQWTVILR